MVKCHWSLSDVFWCIWEVQKDTSGMKWINLLALRQTLIITCNKAFTSGIAVVLVMYKTIKCASVRFQN